MKKLCPGSVPTSRIELEESRLRPTSDHGPLKCGVPQGSVLGPVIFTLYTAPIQRIIREHEVKHNKYADGIQLYVKYEPAVPGAREETCTKEICCITRHEPNIGKILANTTRGELEKRTIFNKIWQLGYKNKRHASKWMPSKHNTFA